MSGRRDGLLGAGLALAALSLPCRGRAADAPVNAIVVVVDALRADHLGCYGYGRPTTPNIDALAGEGTLFSAAVTQATWTLPAVSSLMTSLYPSVHGATRNAFSWLEKGRKRVKNLGPGYRLDESRLTLAESLRRSGLRTAAFVNPGFPDEVYGFGQGFQEYHDKLPRLKDIVDAVIPWVGAHGRKPFFLYIHTTDVHCPYGVGQPYDGRWDDKGYRGSVSPACETAKDVRTGRLKVSRADVEHLKALYDGGLFYVDEHLGRLFQALKESGLWDRTIVIVTADHGEAFQDHGDMLGHGRSPYDEIVRVPLVARFPGAPSGRSVPAVVRLIDLFPTVLDGLGLPPVEGLSGLSVLPLAMGRDMPRLAAFTEIIDAHPEARDGVFASEEPFRGVTVRTAGWKFAHWSGKKPDELYDLSKDPKELRNLAGEEPAVTASFLDQVRAWDAELEEERRRLPGVSGRESKGPDAGTVRMLERMGYLE